MSKAGSTAVAMACVVACLAGAPRGAFGEEVNYSEGFEGGKNPVSFWTRGPYGEYKVNYAGLTAERVRSGKKSYKLDITFIKDGNYNYWAGPILDIPAVPGMKMTGYIYLEQVPRNVNVGLGHSFFLPAYSIRDPKSSGRGMCGPVSQLGMRSKGKWIPQEADLNMVGESMSMGSLKEPTPGIRFEKWYIHITCRNAENARLVIYLDDISVKGSVPDNWEALTEQKLTDWEVLDKDRDRVSHDEFEKALAPFHGRIERLLATIPRAEDVRRVPPKPWGEYAISLARKSRAKADELLKATSPGQNHVPKKPKEYLRNIRDTGIRPLAMAITNLRNLVGYSDPCLVFIQDSPITNYRALPTTVMVDGIIGNEIRTFASPGEYEPAAFVLMPSRDTTVTFQLPDLRSGDNVIGADSLNLRVVKVWFQAGIEVGEVNKCILTPELLLKDDDLVTVDYDRRINVVRDIDAPKDAPELMPVRIPKRTARQFWLTVHVPDNAPAGIYTGNITVRAQGLGERVLKLSLLVLPIQLAEPHLEYSIYYRAQLASETPGVVTSERKSAEQLEAEFRNMKVHGITNPDVYQKVDIRADGTIDFAQLDRYLEIKKRAGLKLDPLYFLGLSAGRATDEAKIQERLALLKQVMTYARGKGIKEVYFYGSDEARGEELRRQRKMWEAIHGMGGKIFVACSTGFFELVGDLLDLPIIARQSPADVPRAHALGYKVHNYANPSGAIEQPYSFRHNAGLWLSRSGMDGFHTYAYQHGPGPGKGMGRLWDDFDDKVYRSLAFAYPTVDGVVDTLQWEGLREGVDDVRYLTTLRKAIEDGKNSEDGDIRKLASANEEWLSRLNIEGDLQEIRREMALRIMQLPRLGK